MLTGQYNSLVHISKTSPLMGGGRDISQLLQIINNNYYAALIYTHYTKCFVDDTGRTHRSNQVSAPEYIFLISALAGEQRFASIVAKRLQSLGALTHGDRRASDSRDLNKFNVDTKFGRQALDIALNSILGQELPITKVDKYPTDFFKRKYFTINVNPHYFPPILLNSSGSLPPSYRVYQHPDWCGDLQANFRIP